VTAIGEGLSFDLVSFDVNLSREHPGFIRVSRPAGDAARWSMVHLELVGYRGAAVIDEVVRDTNCSLLDLTVSPGRTVEGARQRTHAGPRCRCDTDPSVITVRRGATSPWSAA
jgi:hypothetical protein